LILQLLNVENMNWSPKFPCWFIIQIGTKNHCKAKYTWCRYAHANCWNTV